MNILIQPRQILLLVVVSKQAVKDSDHPPVCVYSAKCEQHTLIGNICIINAERGREQKRTRTQSTVVTSHFSQQQFIQLQTQLAEVKFYLSLPLAVFLFCLNSQIILSTFSCWCKYFLWL
jgi:hypothetical protein